MSKPKKSFNKLKKSFDAAAQSTMPVEAFCYAADEGNCAEVARLLDTYGASIINAQNATGHTALTNAAWNGHKDIVEVLLDKGAPLGLDIDGKTKDAQMTALMHAAWQGHKDIAELLLNKGANTGKKDCKGRTAQEIAEFLGQIDAADLIKEWSARLHAEKKAAAAEAKAAELEQEILAKAGPLRHDIPAPKVIRFPQPGE